MENCFLTTYRSSFMVHWWVKVLQNVETYAEGAIHCLIQKTEGKLPSTYTRKVLVVLYAKLKLRN
jgi:hypothetical protein